MTTHEVVKGLDGVLASLERINSSQDLTDARGHAGNARQELRKLRVGLVEASGQEANHG